MSWFGELILNVHNWWNSVSKVKASLKKDADPLRIGVLAAAAINYAVIIDTTQTHPGATLVGIAARSKSKAEAQIAKYGIGATCKAYGSYEELLAEKDIDAVYIPTPNALHTVWAIKAMKAGKHVLIEKPIASNADEVRQIRETAQQTGKVALEAFHWRFHPAAHHCKAIIESGKYGAVTGVWTCMKLFKGVLGADDIRFDYKLGGGACMDLTYPFSACSYFASPAPVNCDVNFLDATPRLNKKDKLIDEAMHATFTMQEPGKKPVKCEINIDTAVPHLLGFIPKIWTIQPLVFIHLEMAEIEFTNFVGPHNSHAITIKEKNEKGKLTGKQHVEKCYVDGPQWHKRGQDWWTTYRYQLEGFVDMVKAKEQGVEYRGPCVTLEESEKMMQTIDQAYEKAGLPKRGL